MEKRYDVIIVGAGIAGLTAGIYSRRAGKTVLIFEGKVPGGQIINTLQIENWPGDFGVSGVELIQKIQKQAVELGIELEMDEVVNVRGHEGSFVVEAEDGEYEAKAVILAVGSEDKKLGLKREDELTGKGVSYCATCDGAFYKGKNVAVIGGGNTALQDALYLSELAEKVYLVHRRDEFRGDKVLVDRLREKKNVEFILGYIPGEILGEERVSGVRLVPSGLVDEIKEGRELEVDGMFVAIGKKPITSAFSELVDLDKNGYIVAGEDCRTSCRGVFVAGDCRTKDVRQLVTAASDGAIAVDSLLS